MLNCAALDTGTPYKRSIAPSRYALYSFFGRSRTLRITTVAPSIFIRRMSAALKMRPFGPVSLHPFPRYIFFPRFGLGFVIPLFVFIRSSIPDIHRRAVGLYEQSHFLNHMPPNDLITD